MTNVPPAVIILDMEIYRNRSTTVRFRAPFDAGAIYSVEIKSPEHTSIASAQVVLHPDLMEHFIEIPVDYQHTLYDGVIEFKITVTESTTHTYSEYVDVVTPLFRAEDVPSNYPKEDVPELERLVRKVIEARTGMTFGRVKKKMVVDGSVNVVSFDIPLIEFTGVSSLYATHSTTLNPPKESYEIAADRFSATINWDHYDIKTDSTWIISKRAPRAFVIEGTFGYSRVPQDVKEAALLIAGVWGCEQAVWRDRFIQTMRSSDWSVQYNEGAYESTGSATADQLLAKYSRRYLPEVF